MALKVEKGISAYKCPVCKMHGRISSLLRVLGEARGEDYSTLIEEADHLDMVASVIPTFDQMTQGAKVRPQPLDEALFEGMFVPVKDVPRAVEYLVNRYVSPQAAEYCDLGWDQEKRRIVFPVRDREGLLYGWSGRAIHAMQQPKVLDYAGLPKRALILGEHKWETGKPIILVEGLIAYARFITEGAHSIANIGAVLGSELTEEKEEILKSWGLPVHLFVDPDPAGDAFLFGKPKINPETREPEIDPRTKEIVRRTETGAIARLCKEIPVFVPAYPEGINDPDDLSFDDIEHMLKNTRMSTL
jgi:hypothetical protein